MAEPARKLASYDDLYNIPENTTGEIIDGELIVSPRPSPEHMFTSSNLGLEIGPPYARGRGGPGGWIILYETEIKLDEDVFVPDLAGWKKERFSKPKDQNWVSVAPDWVCEVLSPGSIRHDRITKARTYARHRIPYFWLLDPRNKTLDVFRLEAGKWIPIGVYAEADKVRAEPFQEIEIDLGNLWLEEQPQPPEK